MSSLTQKRKNDKVVNSKKFNLSQISRIIRADLEYGYKDISIRDIGDGYYEISKWNLGENQ
jgi:hypothetical protein